MYMTNATPIRISACSCSESSRLRSWAQMRRRPAGDRLEPVTGRLAASAFGPGGGQALGRQDGKRGRGGGLSRQQQPLLQHLGADRRADQMALHLVAAEAAQP